MRQRPKQRLELRRVVGEHVSDGWVYFRLACGHEVWGMYRETDPRRPAFRRHCETCKLALLKKGPADPAEKS
jgi:hypothetical protein